MEGIVSMWTQIIAGLGGMAATTFRISGILVVAWIVVAAKSGCGDHQPCEPCSPSHAMWHWYSH